MTSREIYLTPQGLAKLETELENLRTVKRQQVADRIHQAKESGSTDDNAEYEEAKNELAFVEGRILTLEKMLQNAVIIKEEKAHPGQVKLGSTVIVRDPDGQEEHYLIVGSAEADPKQGKISNQSPVGLALLGKKAGDKVEVRTPAGARRLHVVQIS
jgi:transcription elongation factor GreA